MKLYFLTCVFACTMYLTDLTVNAQNANHITLYDNTTPGESSIVVTLNGSVSDLTKSHPELGGTLSYCNIGIPLSVLYTEVNFTGNAICSQWTRPSSYCRQLGSPFAGNIKSARFAGSNPSRPPSIALFKGESFSGDITDYYGSQHVLVSEDYLSFITQGGIPVTIFEKSNYQGFRRCFQDAGQGIGFCGQSLRDLGFTQMGSFMLGMCIE